MDVERRTGPRFDLTHYMYLYDLLSLVTYSLANVLEYLRKGVTEHRDRQGRTCRQQSCSCTDSTVHLSPMYLECGCCNKIKTFMSQNIFCIFMLAHENWTFCCIQNSQQNQLIYIDRFVSVPKYQSFQLYIFMSIYYMDDYEYIYI